MVLTYSFFEELKGIVKLAYVKKIAKNKTGIINFLKYAFKGDKVNYPVCFNKDSKRELAKLSILIAMRSSYFLVFLSILAFT